jgi:hypothetical protein
MFFKFFGPIRDNIEKTAGDGTMMMMMTVDGG